MVTALILVGVGLLVTPGETSAASKPTGSPIVLFVEVDTYNFFAQSIVGATAAARAINAAGGIKDPNGGPNHPLKIVSCQEGTANEAAGAEACGREAISDHALAAVGTDSEYSQNFDSVILPAGIPDIPALGTSADQFTSPLSFPMTDVMASSIGYPFLAKALGLSKVFPVDLQIPGETLSSPFSAAAVDKLAGVSQGGSTTVIGGSTSTPDFTPNAAAFASSGVKFLYFSIGPQGVLLMKDLLSQGVNFESTAVTADENVISGGNLSPLGNHKNGLYFIGNSFPATYTQNPGVARFNKEIAQYGHVPGIGGPSTPRTEEEQAAWGAVQIVGMALSHMKTLNSAALAAELPKLGPVQLGGLPTVDFSKPAFPSSGFSSLLSHLRIFNNQMMVTRVINGTVTPCVSDFVPVAQPFKITNRACQLS